MSVALLLAGGVLGLAVAVLALVRPRVALVLLVVFDLANLNGVVAEQTGVSPYRGMLALAVVALGVTLVRHRSRLAWSPVLLGLAVLFAGFAVSLVGAADPAGSAALLLSRVRDLFSFAVVYALLLTTRAARPLVQATVLVLAGLAALTMVHEFVLDNRGDLFGLSNVPLVQESGAATPRHAGTSSDVNFWGRLLILFTPLALSLAAASLPRSRRSVALPAGTPGFAAIRPRRLGLPLGPSTLRRWTFRAEPLVFAGCGISLLAGVYLTQSRGGFLAVFLGVAVWLALAGGWYRRALFALPLVVAVLVPLTGIGSRLGTLTAAGGAADASVVERQRLQRAALRMFVDRPVNGHGIGSYPSVFRDYDRLADTYHPVEIKVAAHNLYLEQAADGGILLFVAWTVFLGTVVFAATRALVLASRAADRAATTRWLAVGVLAGLAGWLLASAFLHLSDLRALLVVAALAAVLDIRARALPAAPAVPRVRSARMHRTLAAALVVLLVGSAGGLAAALATSRVGYRASATLAVVPATTSPSGGTAYQLDVVSRGIIVPTLATVLSSVVAPAAGDATITITPSKEGGALLVSVTGPSRAATETAGRAAVARAKTSAAALATGYRLTGEIGVVENDPSDRLWLAVPCALGVAASSLALLRVRRRRANIGSQLGGLRSTAR